MGNITVTPKETGTASLQILVVEDNVDTAISQARALQAMGHEAHVAGNGLAALEMMQEHMPDVVLLDIGLPGIVDGWKVAEIIRAQATDKRPFVIAVTGRGLAQDVNHSLEAGIDLHLVKPVDPRNLEIILRSIATDVK